MIKFPTEYGVGEVQGDQLVAHECYITMLEMDDHLQSMCIEEQWTMTELVEGLEEFLFDDPKPDQITRIGTLASLPVQQELTTFLRKNQDVFAWNHKDMHGIDPFVIVHKLNVMPSFLYVHQKKCVFA